MKKLHSGEELLVPNWNRHLSPLILLLGFSLASALALPYAGGWNDGSRLASVESLVDRHTWKIDDSIFVRVPQSIPIEQSPYPPGPMGNLLRGAGTLDKLQIHGNYYSDKSPVPAVFMAGAYQLLQLMTGLKADRETHWFCWLLTLATSGLAYGIAVMSVERMGRALRLDWQTRILLCLSFAVGTVSLTYSRQVNNHILLLGVAMPLFAELAWLSRGVFYHTAGRLILLGILGGLAYTIDLGAGPFLTGLTGIAILLRCQSLRSIWIYGGMALPWVLLHHGLNYFIGGMWSPANSNPEYLNWPGSPFTLQTMTGGWHHSSFGKFLLYSLDLLVGKKGFLLHNLPLLTLLAFAMSRRSVQGIRIREGIECWIALGWSVSVWLVYAICSTNSSGFCCSIRWFVPLLAPGFFLLAVLVREKPIFRWHLLVLTGWGLLLGIPMTWNGPWFGQLQPGYWFIVGGALASWISLMAILGNSIRKTDQTSVFKRELSKQSVALLR